MNMKRIYLLYLLLLLQATAGHAQDIVSLYQNQAPNRYHRDNEGNSKMYIALADG